MLVNSLVLLSGLLAGQTPTVANPAGIAPALAPPATSNSPVRLSGSAPPPASTPTRYQTLAPELMAEALVIRQGSAVNGRPLTLATALGSVTDRRQQLEVTHAYWRLTEAVARYNFHFDRQGQLQRLAARGDGSSLLQAAKASATAGLREAELAAVNAQMDLAAAAIFPPGAPLVVPADRPHVGAYRTNFNELFSMRAAPPRARLIDELLPPLFKAIEVRANAVDAALKAQTAALDAYQADRVDLGTALSWMVEYQRQREAFVDLVCRYNDNIADYALNVVGITANGPGLVSLLISQPQDAAQPAVFENDPNSGIAAGRATTGIGPPSSTMIPGTMAAPPGVGMQIRGGLPMNSSGVPTLAPPRPAGPDQNFGSPATAQPFSQPIYAPPAGVPTLAPPPSGQPTLAPPPPGQSGAGPSATLGQPTLAPPPPAAGATAPPPNPQPTSPQPPNSPPLNPQPSTLPHAALAPPLVPMDGGVIPATALIENGPGMPATPTSSTAVGPAGAPAPLVPDASRPLVPLVPPSLQPTPTPAENPAAPGKNDWRAPPAKQTSAPPAPRLWTVAWRDAETAAVAPSSTDYSGLLQAAPLMQAQKLAATLHASANTPERLGEPVALLDCLRGQAPSQRQAVIEAFWTARQRAAEYQVLVGQREMFRGLSSTAAARGGTLAPGLQARLESALLAAEAQVLEGRAALIETQFELAAQMGRSNAGVWPLPTAVPNAGPFGLKLEGLPVDLAHSTNVRRLAFTIPLLCQAVQEHATAVVASDHNRAELMRRFDPATAGAERPLAAIGRQTAETFAFLRILSELNRAIAGYALTTLPRDVLPEQLVGTLAGTS